MKFSASKPPSAPAIALTSMLDVIFLLLCFFVTASVYSQWESEVSIQLPSASNSDEPFRLPGEIIANVAKDGSVRVNGQLLTLEQLADRLSQIATFYSDQAVIVRADRDVRYESLMKVIDACRGAGVWNFSLATANEEAGR